MIAGEGTFDYRKNCISLLRLIAAFQVMWGHLVEHLKVTSPMIGDIAVDKGISWILYFFNGVPLFFFLSGFLIWISIEKYNNYRAFYCNRFFRIFPELWGGVLAETILILTFVSPIQWKDLFLFVGTQATFLQFWTPDSLRSFGCGTPNGALWTICVLIQFYIIVWSLKNYAKQRSIGFWIVWGIVLIGIGAATGFLKGRLVLIVYKLYCETIFQYLWIFWLGIILAEYKDIVIPVLRAYWWVALIGAILMRFSPIDLQARNYMIMYTICCCLFSIGVAYRFANWDIRVDISYALFIYHMLVVNAFIELGHIDDVVSFIACIAVSIIVAYLSTITIGKMSSKFKIGEKG